MTWTVSADTVLDGRYRLIERIAVGGQGEVWRAEDVSLGRPAAVKVLRSEYADNAEFRARFRREAQHAAGLSHPGVAQIFDYNEGRDGVAPYLVMEYVEGESLSAAIAREAPVDADIVVEVVVAAAAALAAAHAAGLVHRDVKPGNLLLGRDGSIKIVDFGIARAVDAIPLTRTGMLMGTPLYLAPEQAIGRPATAASDLYALGIIAFEALTGRPPYEGLATAVLLAHRDAPLPPLPASVPSGLADLVRALTAKDPAMRPENATAVAEWATRLRADPTMTPPPGLACVAVTRLDGAGPVPDAGRRDHTQVMARPLAGPWHRRLVPYVLGGVAIALLAGVVGWFARPEPAHRPVAAERRSAAPAASPTPSPSHARTTTPPVKRPVPASHQARAKNRGRHGRHGKGHPGH
ncbi:serine/threonine-protein kinase [Actinomadura sp. DC4]|uniref:serine/threonine-protein kinase n=1 Tax=Actinomadura sp. DC4 TaxID=3055069 RepID=UPI0025B0CB8F|nr:serine/threonine-protein kinase [Actinomadura sp. DC4]MDN3358665.1 protein kinase [Actinomadura sp. DC4]